MSIKKIGGKPWRLQGREQVTITPPGSLGALRALVAGKVAMGNSGKIAGNPPRARETPGARSLGDGLTPMGSIRRDEAGGPCRDRADPGDTGQCLSSTPRLLSGPTRLPPLHTFPIGNLDLLDFRFRWSPPPACHLRTQFRSVHTVTPPPGPSLRISRTHRLLPPETSQPRERRLRPSTPASVGTRETPAAGLSGSSPRRRPIGRRDTGSTVSGQERGLRALKPRGWVPRVPLPSCSPKGHIWDDGWEVKSALLVSLSRP